jgi:ABC-type cobalamin/Fe3+-siderophores transport system ATPase subunit
MTTDGAPDGPYASLLDEIDAQRKRMSFFVPTLFHAHSIDSHDWAQRRNADTQRNEATQLATDAGVEQFLDELAARYRIVAITDHMRCGYATRLAKAALARDDITVLPGMEINCLVAPHYADAIHVLAVFPPETSEIAIERIFEGLELPDPPDRRGTETVRFESEKELRDRVRRAGGLFVVPHIENERRGHRARFRTDRGQTLKLFSDRKEIESDLAEEYGVLLANLQPNAIELQSVHDQKHFARFTADGGEHQVACVAPADHHCFEDYEKPDTATLLKVPRLDFHSVSDALRFHETRVRLPGQATDHTAPRLVGLRLNSPRGQGLFTDTTIAFSPDLNCLIGPRGSGKSTVIEALRYVLGRNAQLAERAGREVKSFADLATGTQTANLRDTRLELVYEHADGSRAVLSASFDSSEPSNTRAFTIDGEDLRISPEALLDEFPVAIFSWSEMEVLGRESGPQRDLVDRLLPGVRALVSTRDAVRARLAVNREAITGLVRQLRRAREANGGRLVRYRQHREAFNAINTPEAEALFAGLDEARKRREVLAVVGEQLERVAETGQSLAETTIAANVAAAVEEAGETVSAWWEEGPGRSLDLSGLDAQVFDASDVVGDAVEQRTTSLATLQAAAEEQAQAVEHELREKTRIDDEQDLLRDQRELARERYETVAADRQAYLVLIERLDAALTERDELLGQLLTAQAAVSDARRRGLAPLNERLGSVGGDDLRIEVECEELADRGDIVEFLNEFVLDQERAGRYRSKEVAQRLAHMAHPAELSAGLVLHEDRRLSTSKAAGEEGALTVEETAKLLEGCVWRKPDEDAVVDVVDAVDVVGPLLELAEQHVDDLVRIRLNGTPVDALSPGQRSSAMLPLIALAETDPLIIDQPEDNLDNAMVGATLTRILAELKERRQVIVSTHNPNIVVGGDAEQIVVLDAPGAQEARVVETGSIDETLIIDAVLTIMEGGRDAFDARSKRYGAGRSN